MPFKLSDEFIFFRRFGSIFDDGFQVIIFLCVALNTHTTDPRENQLRFYRIFSLCCTNFPFYQVREWKKCHFRWNPTNFYYFYVFSTCNFTYVILVLRCSGGYSMCISKIPVDKWVQQQPAKRKKSERNEMECSQLCRCTVLFCECVGMISSLLIAEMFVFAIGDYSKSISKPTQKKKTLSSAFNHKFPSARHPCWDWVSVIIWKFSSAGSHYCVFVTADGYY